jgi:hypothetical protein
MRASSESCCAAMRSPGTDVMSDAYQKADATQYELLTAGQENEAVTIAVMVIPCGSRQLDRNAVASHAKPPYCNRHESQFVPFPSPPAGEKGMELCPAL